MNAHTPGPWSVLLNPMGNDSITAEDCRICDMPGWDADYMDEEMANAQLIAAAPDLLAACKLFMTYHDGVDKYDVAMMLAYADAEQAIRVAVAKATGGAA